MAYQLTNIAAKIRFILETRNFRMEIFLFGNWNIFL